MVDYLTYYYRKESIPFRSLSELMKKSNTNNERIIC